MGTDARFDVVNYDDLTSLTDSEIQANLDRYESAQRYAESIQTDGRTLSVGFSVVSVVTGRVSKVLGAVAEVFGMVDEDISSLSEEIAATNGQVEAMAAAIVDAEDVLASRVEGFPLLDIPFSLAFPWR